MKTTRTIEVNVCDLCRERTAYGKCQGCGMDICGDCPVVEFKTSVVGGGYSVYYCRDCDISLCETKSDPLHVALMRVRELRAEESAFYREWTSGGFPRRSPSSSCTWSGATRRADTYFFSDKDVLYCVRFRKMEGGPQGLQSKPESN